MTDRTVSHEPTVWLNGVLVPLSRAAVSPVDRGFLYGDGVFETMRAQHGRILDLERHLERLCNSLAALRIKVPAEIGWHAALSELLEANALSRKTASVKIVVTRGIMPELGLPPSGRPTVLMVAKPYEPPTDEDYEVGWKLVIHRGGFSPPLARHKTLNYLQFLTARQDALDQGANEAVVLDPSGAVAETAAGTLLIQSMGCWWTPHSPFQLPSITLTRLEELLAQEGQPVERRRAGVEALQQAERVWVLNSLMLIMPACQLNGRRLPDPGSAEAAHWRRVLLSSP